jgi:beta-mannosidase
MRRAIYSGGCIAVFSLWALNYLSFSSLDLPHHVAAALMARHRTQAFLTAALVTASYGQQVLNLSDVDWTVTSPNFTSISVPGKVPSQAHLDLYAANVRNPEIAIGCNCANEYL